MIAWSFYQGVDTKQALEEFRCRSLFGTLIKLTYKALSEKIVGKRIVGCGKVRTASIEEYNTTPNKRQNIVEPGFREQPISSQ